MENRFSGASWYNLASTKDVLIAGLGATGSFLSFFLGRTGIYSAHLVDFDTFQPHNCGSQLVSYNDIGRTKLAVANSILNSYTNVSIVRGFSDKIEQASPSLFNKDVIVATIDRMDARKYMFEKFLEFGKPQSLFIDTRISAEYWEVYTITKENIEHQERYRATLFSDEEGNTGACNYQQSTHSAAGAAIQATELFTNHLNNILLEEDYLPFKVSKDLRTQNIKYEY
jgi:hypothetical protein